MLWLASYYSKAYIVKKTLLTLLCLFSTSSFAQSYDGKIYFSGSIVESTC